MEEPGYERCCAIYFCPSRNLKAGELFKRMNPPATTRSHMRHNEPTLDQVNHNVAVLLDEDQGNFETVFVTSSADECHDRLGREADTTPTVVFIQASAELEEAKKHNVFPFLRALTADVQGARYQQPVMSFVLVQVSSLTDSQDFLDAAMTQAYLSAGAVDMVKSPFTPTGLNRVVGQIRERIRPPARILGAGMAQNLVDSIRDSTEPRVANHRPDEFLTSSRRQTIETAIAKWQFPAHEFDMDELTYGAMFILEHILRHPALEQYVLPRPELMTFLLATRRQYKHEREVHYHNWRHAVDVTQSLYCFLCDIHLCPPVDPMQPTKKEMTALERLITPVDALVLLVSAIGHDVGHPGVNNAFLVASNHPLAHMYNDKSVLENYHCAAYSQLLRRHWPSLGQIPQFRSTMISTILATDMQRHFDYMGQLGDLKQKIDRSMPGLEDWKDKDREHARELVMSLMIKAADISNVARPFDISAHWARILMNEFSRQGELESELQIPTCLFGGPPKQGDILAAAESQKGFMNLFGFPLFRGISEVMPNVSCTAPELENNTVLWDQKIKEEKNRRETGGGGSAAPPTFSVGGENVKEAKTWKRESEPVALLAGRGPSTPTKRHSVVDGQSSPSRHLSDKRSSPPSLAMSTQSLSPTGTGPSRRSSKDVALNHLQELGAWAQQNPAGSRRASADANCQMHQSYPGSRRGSKDESLTTILITSQGSSSQRSVPPSPGKPMPPPSPTKAGPGKRQSATYGPKPPVGAAARHSVPSSRSHATSSATAESGQYSPSTQPSSFAPTDDEPTPPAHHGSIAATEDPFNEAADWPNTYDGQHRASAPDAVPSTPPPLGGAGRLMPTSPRRTARQVGGDSAADDTPRTRLGQSPHDMRESRSRSRLRGLKFWKRKKDAPGVESGEAASPP